MWECNSFEIGINSYFNAVAIQLMDTYLIYIATIMDTLARLKCDLCPKTYLSQHTLTAHMCVHTGKYPFTCGICGKGEITVSRMKLHNRIHTGEKPFNCSKCTKCYADVSLMRLHEKRCGDEQGVDKDDFADQFTSPGSFKCNICSDTFRTHIALCWHFRYKHVKGAAFTCEVCDDKFETQNGLRKHMKNKYIKYSVDNPTSSINGSKISRDPK